MCISFVNMHSKTVREQEAEREREKQEGREGERPREIHFHLYRQRASPIRHPWVVDGYDVGALLLWHKRGRRVRVRGEWQDFARICCCEGMLHYTFEQVTQFVNVNMAGDVVSPNNFLQRQHHYDPLRKKETQVVLCCLFQSHCAGRHTETRRVCSPRHADPKTLFSRVPSPCSDGSVCMVWAACFTPLQHQNQLLWLVGYRSRSILCEHSFVC